MVFRSARSCPQVVLSWQNGKGKLIMMVLTVREVSKIPSVNTANAEIRC